MSDGITDAHRAGKLDAAYADYVHAFARFIEDRSLKNKNSLLDQAKKVQGMRPGYWGGPPKVHNNLDCHLNDIENAFEAIANGAHKVQA